jgi:hypothetical protein
MLNDKINKKKTPWVTWVNLLNSRLEPWNRDNPIEKKSKQIMKLISQSTQCWRMKSREKNQLKKEHKK